MKKNIAIIIQKLNGGGAERTACNLSIALQKTYNVHLIAFDCRDIKYPYSGKLHDLKVVPSKSIFKQIANVIKRTILIRNIKSNENIIASISLMDGANLVNCLSKCDDKIITSVRIQMSKSRFKTLFSKYKNIFLMKLIAFFSDYIVGLSEGVSNDLIDNFYVAKDKVVTIYNPCDGELLKEKALKNMNNAKEMVYNSVITMGRMTEQKGQWHLIRAFAYVVKYIPDAKLYILGDGPLKEKLVTLVNDLGISESVEFLGFIEAPHAYIMNSRVFVFPSLYEGLGNVLLEAMACGVPCISTDCFSGPREILAPGTKIKGKFDEVEYGEYGMLVSELGCDFFDALQELNEEELQLATAILEILKNDQLHKKYCDCSINRIQDFSPSNIAQQWINLIN